MQKHCTKCKVEKALDAFSPKLAARDGRASHCKSCQSVYARARAKVPGQAEKRAAWAASWYEKNAEDERAKARAQYQQNAEIIRAQSIQRHRDNPERSKANTAAWRKANADRVNSLNARRRAAFVLAQPAWATQFFIDEAYDLARRRDEATGFKWHVDHIVPLQGKTVCGLHVESNLQVIPATVNLKKHNTAWPDMWSKKCS